MTKVGSIFRRHWVTGRIASALGADRDERFMHTFAAVLVAVVMAVALFLEPVDWALWSMQARLANQQPSGEIVYLHIDPTITASDSADDRLKLARALDRLRSEGADRVFLNVVLARSKSNSADDVLARSMADWGRKLTIVDRIDFGPNGKHVEQRTSTIFSNGHMRAWQGSSGEWPGFVWKLRYSYPTSRGVEPSFSAALAGIPGNRTGDFRVGYGIRSRSIPEIRMKSLLTDGPSLRLAHRTIVIGTIRQAGSTEYFIPGQLLAQPSYVAINAAESLKRSRIEFMPGYVAVAILGLFLACAVLIERSDRRKLGYCAAAGLPMYLFCIGNSANLRVELSYCLVLLVVYAALRSRSRWRARLARIDPDTGLPTFKALIRHLASGGTSDGHVVVAKIHGYETILRTLDNAQRASYIQKLVERLRIGDAKLLVFVENHYLAWQVDHQDPDKLRGHLEGLRAIFAAPVTVGDQRIDVGITFGAAPIHDVHAERCLAAAHAAVEETSEALEPVKLADDTSSADSLWDLSLRARIDAAMEAGEVFCVYQPKIDIAADRIEGVEALVRWEDPERGFIPPMHFVMQCEKAGRMEYLTRYVLQSACSAGKLLHFRGNRITMSVNISATLLTDMRIVGIVRNVLQATDFDANYLVLEITETARIRDLRQARTVLNALKALGTHLSMDDFGVGAANFEALQALPFDEIKIDRQFVSRASTSTKSRAITASIVGLGTSARIAVVAEGAETAADLQMLREIGCWQVQGFALARPMPLTNLLTFIDGHGDAAERAAI